MEKYLSIKEVHAEIMSSSEFKNWRAENPNLKTMDGTLDDGLEGYHVVYDKDTDGEYHSWSPKDKFDKGNVLVGPYKGNGLPLPGSIVQYDYCRGIEHKGVAKVRGYNGFEVWLKTLEGTNHFPGTDNFVITVDVDFKPATEEQLEKYSNY